MNEDIATATCSRCGRARREKFLVTRKNRKGKPVMRCRARSVCASIARRNREKTAKNVS